MSNPTVSLRMSDYHLARGLQAIRLLEPNWKLTTTSDLVRTIVNDYIAKSEHFNNTPLTINQDLLQEIIQARLKTTSKPKQLNQVIPIPQLGNVTTKAQKSARQLAEEAEQDRYFNELKAASLAKAEQEKTKQVTLASQISAQPEPQAKPANQTKPATQTTFPKASEFHDPNITESKISSVTDFSPPADWIED